MNNLMSIGTVIQLKDNMFCIVGYGDITVNGETLCGYKLVPYPIGYLDPERMFFISLNEECSVVKEGYKNENFFKAAETLKNIFSLSAKANGKQLEAIIRQYKNVVYGKGE